jgi:hypothetical protein
MHDAVRMFENYATVGKDPDVKAFARETLPVLKEHLARIMQIDQEITRTTAK